MISLLALLKELTTPRSELRTRISDQQFEIAEHVLKFLILRSDASDSRDTWAHDIETFLAPLVALQAHNKKYPKASTYKELLFNPRFESYSEYLNTVKNVLNRWSGPKNKYVQLQKRDISSLEFYKTVESFYNEICKLMSEGHEPTELEIYNLLNV